ncbi:ABC transporter substrate-binding protein [Pseudoalteromonas luteoviolacea]|uniref:ABC transporter substrate-binding protein n=1 Tax=Pseudoalteromonas luteoviolacea TaxID=43657 RepID=UPI001B395769|nr:ABC transporter substrate-binding protein [Pseudoalteromonas luteoviolacea]MBQ4813331.1 ABC transporter substrate-binding protein [Pseudoalteromonas luteoviolacea]
MRRFILLFCVFVSALLSHSANAQFPITVKDDRNKLVTINSAPNKVAAVSVFGADLLNALGMQAAGISTLNHQRSPYLGDQTQHMVDLGEIHETNLEVLTALKPDLTIGLRTYTEPFASKFEEIGPFLAYDLVTKADSDRAIRSATKALGKPAQGVELNQSFNTQLKRYASEPLKPQSVVFLWHWSDVPYAFFDHHFTVQMMHTLNAKNGVGTSPQPNLKKFDSAPISMESLLKLNPDVIISFKGEPGPFKSHPVWQQLKAVKNGRAYRVADHYVMPHGPIARSLILQELAHLFHPDKFSAPTTLIKEARATTMQFGEL